MNKRDRSIANMRSEAQRIYYQRQEIKRLQQENDKLKQQAKKQKEVIDKAIEYINKHDDGCYTDITCKCKVAELNITKLLNILKEVSK